MQVVQADRRHSQVIAEFNQAMAIKTEGKKSPWGKIHPGIKAILQDGSLGFYLVALYQRAKSSDDSRSHTNGVTGTTVCSGGFKVCSSHLYIGRREDHWLILAFKVPCFLET